MRTGLTASIALVVLSAAMAVAVFPPFSCSLLAPFAWIPLFIALQKKSARAGFRLGVLHGLLLYAGTLNWFFQVFGAPSLVLILMLALFPGVFASCAAALSRLAISPALTALATAVVWTGCEYYRCEWFMLRFPWITPGVGLPPNLLTPVVGVYGISFLVALAAALVAGDGRRFKAAGGLLLALLLMLNIFRPGVVKPVNPIRVGAIQTEAQDLDTNLKLSASIPGQVDAIVWPEYALADDVRNHPEALEKIRNMMTEKGAQLLVLANPVIRPDGKSENTALSIGRSEIFGTHVKNRPVHMMNDGVPGKIASVIPTPFGRIATPICFDNDYESVDRQAVRDGAEFLLVPSMDSMEWSQRQHLQHAVFVLHRAAENGRWIVVSSTSGKTQIVDPHGNVTPEVIPLMREGQLIGDIDRETHRTFYNRAGWILGPLCVFAAAAILIGLLVRSFLDWRGHRPAPPEESAPAVV
ncbi:MAG: lnt [Akkermansiaceae bacterium]|nr:lnt [Akkermansiaceae bacterium]